MGVETDLFLIYLVAKLCFQLLRVFVYPEQLPNVSVRLNIQQAQLAISAACVTRREAGCHRLMSCFFILWFHFGFCTATGKLIFRQNQNESNKDFYKCSRQRLHLPRLFTVVSR